MGVNYFKFWYLAALGLTLVVVGCSSVPTDDASGAEKRAVPRYNLWTSLAEFGAEPGDYGTYSYVLSGHDGSDPRQLERYEKLLEAIHGIATNVDVSDSVFSLEKEYANLFLIPVNRYDSGEQISLSKTLLDILSGEDSRFRRPGPFIVTTYHPISADQEQVDLLYVDLTHIHPDAMKELVYIYINRVSAGRLSGIQALHSIKLSILNSLLVANESFGYATVALSELAGRGP